MDRPSGDQRGSVMPTDPGRVAIFWLLRSKMCIAPFGSWAPNEEPKTTVCPSGDQSGSLCFPLPSGSSLRGTPPSAETM